MSLNNNERKNLRSFLRNFLANNRNSNFIDILVSLNEEAPELAAKLRMHCIKSTCEIYLARYILPIFVKEGWLQITNECTEVELSPERCAYCFKNIEDIYVVDIEHNHYCGWDCTEKCHYYCDPYENHLDVYHFLFSKFVKWLPYCRSYFSFQEKERSSIENLTNEILLYVYSGNFDEFRSPRGTYSRVEAEIHRMLTLLDKEVRRLHVLMYDHNLSTK